MFKSQQIFIDLENEYDEDKELLDLLEGKSIYFLNILDKKENNEKENNKKKVLCEDVIPEEDEEKQKTEIKFYNKNNNNTNNNYNYNNHNNINNNINVNNKELKVNELIDKKNNITFSF